MAATEFTKAISTDQDQPRTFVLSDHGQHLLLFSQNIPKN
jgi:6-phosphogluconolactonase (cycloisomerase 2 family)